MYGQFVDSIMMDNGIEFVSWEFLAHVHEQYHIEMYYSHPNRPEERGINERRNCELRHIVGYGGYSAMTQLEWDKACQIANSKPMREALDGQTPAKAYHKACLARIRYMNNKKKAQLDD